MLKMYCSECGCGVEYLANKPKFCTNCGTSFNKNLINKNISVQKPVLKDDIEEDFEDNETEANSVPEIENLEYDISLPTKHKETIGNLIGTSNGESDLNLPELETKKISRKEFLDNFAKEAGSIRGKNRKKNGPKD